MLVESLDKQLTIACVPFFIGESITCHRDIESCHVFHRISSGLVLREAQLLYLPELHTGQCASKRGSRGRGEYTLDLWSRAGSVMDLRAHLLKAEFELGDIAYGCEIWSYLLSIDGKGFVRFRVI